MVKAIAEWWNGEGDRWLLEFWGAIVGGWSGVEGRSLLGGGCGWGVHFGRFLTAFIHAASVGDAHPTQLGGGCGGDR